MMAAKLDALIHILTQPAASEADIKEAAQAFLDTVLAATPEQVEYALERLATMLEADDVFRAGYAALVIGNMIEHGCDGTAISQPLIARLGAVLKACQPEAALARPREAEAWGALDLFWRPAVVLFSSDAEARRASEPLRSLTQPIAEHHEGAHWLDLMLSTLVAEPLLVIEPATQQGLQGTMTGVVDNFQLHTLLMDVFPAKGWLRRRRVSKSIVDVATGKGPQQTDEAVTGAWNMYAWTALGPDLKLPFPADRKSGQHWIWGEGRPADIPVFEGYRVILLGPPAYARSWTAQRMFAQLPAEIVLSEVLGKNEVTAWLRKMAAR